MLSTQMIGNRIAEARKKENISQAQLAEQLFISPQAVGKWERGESMPDILTFNRLAEIFKVDLNYFSDGAQAGSSEIKADKDFQPSAQEQAPVPKKKTTWDMSQTNLVDNDFSGLKNLSEKFSSSNMLRCLFTGSDMSGLLLKSNNVDGRDFSGSDMSKSQVQNSNLAGNLFKDCRLENTEFSRSFIDGCDFSGADFTGTQFKSGGFGNNITTNATWNHTSFNGMHMADIVFEGTMTDCFFENCAFTRVTFRNATLRNTFFKNNKKMKRVTFIDCQADKLTYAFLKNEKAELAGITMLTD